MKREYAEYVCDGCRARAKTEAFREEEKGNTVHPLPEGWVTINLRQHPRRGRADVCSAACATSVVARFIEEPPDA